ncbi:uncharacterized protein N7515_006913 [Penicillium bovifimosum]|uniref:Uncharacterized protein n=1 Tax=Penicillium bovifimosum TaxID=126998 RepID=A0A9W9GVK4_9EURO|nr:uncharacterized protein N7515_006913 [Penicillium bovifimosum]KAJ5130874.1 hypothetical protein N7515_006913 [Penicillium bovifimosum]
MDGPPPPPPPHGEKPRTTEGEYRKSSDLPDGNYDIFIVPPHSAGAGFLYLPSLQCNRNSFLAGVASTLLACVVWSYISPILKAWYLATVASGNGTGMTVLAVGVGVAGWLVGAAQSNSGDNKGNGSARGGWFGFGGFGGSSGGPGGSRNESNTNQQSSGANHGGNGAGQQRQHQGGNSNGGQSHGNQYSGNQYSSGPPPNSDDNQREKEEAEKRAKEERAREEREKEERAKEERARQERAREERAREERARERAREEAERERAREEAKRKEELRRKMEEFKRKRDAEAKEKERKREREAMEKELKERREQLEKEIAAARAAAEKEAREKLEKEVAEAREKQAKAEAEAKARLEKIEAEARERAAKEAAEKEAAAKAAAQKEAMAKFAALKEAASKKYAEKKAQEAKEAAAKSSPPKPASTSSMPRTPSPKKPPPPYPTAKTANDDDAYSFRPYDRPRRPYAAGTSVYSESSYAPSHSTAHTTPPPSHRSSYTTKDPDKIVIQGVYTFNNAFMKTPISQLVSGQGMISDGLVLRITTEGLFIDDDVRGIGQREWDVKAWTLKLAEVWCSQVNATTSAKTPSSNPFSFRRGNNVPTNEESEAFLNNLLKVCKNTCRLASPRDAFARSATASRDGGPVHAPGAETRGLHVLRASVRDQEGKKYVFVMQESEAWKVAIGLQRLRAGALVRSMGVTGLPAPDCKLMLGSLGYV